MSIFGSSSRINKKVSGNMLARNSSSRVVYVEKEPKTLPDPRPTNYTIKDWKEIKNYLILLIKYNDCTNFEGEKVLVFKDCSYQNLLDQKLIDPHFSEDKSFHSPIARFEPTDEGVRNAVIFVNELIK